jgi:phage protein D
MSLTSNLLDSVGAHADRVALRLGDAATATGKILKRGIVPPADAGQR